MNTSPYQMLNDCHCSLPSMPPFSLGCVLLGECKAPLPGSIFQDVGIYRHYKNGYLQSFQNPFSHHGRYPQSFFQLPLRHSISTSEPFQSFHLKSQSINPPLTFESYILGIPQCTYSNIAIPISTALRSADNVSFRKVLVMRKWRNEQVA